MTPKATPTTPKAEEKPIEFDPKVQLGRSGLKQYGGFVFEDINQKLRGQKAAEAYKEIIQNSALVGGILRLIDLNLRGVPKFVEPFSDDAEDVKRAERVDQALDDMSHSWQDTVSESATMIPYGYAPMEIIWKTCRGWSDDPTERSKYNDGLMMPRKIALRSQDSLFRWDFDDDGGVRAMIQLPPPDFIMRTIPIQKMLLFRPRVEKDNPEGASVLRQGYWNWIMIKRLTEYEAIRGEKDATGILLAEIPAANMAPGATANQSAVLAYAKKLVTGYRVSDQGGFVWPRQLDAQGNELFKLSILSPQGGGSIFDYDKVITRHEVRLAISMLADVILLGHTNVGSWALSKDKTANVLRGAINTWLDAMMAVWNKHFMPRLWALNGWPMDRMATLKHGESQSKDIEALAHAVQMLAQAGMALFPDEELENMIRDEMGWPEKPDELIDQDDAAMERSINPPAPQVMPGQQVPGQQPSKQQLLDAMKRLRKGRHQPRSKRGAWAPPSAPSADVSAALAVLRDRQATGGNDEIAHGFRVADPIPFDPKAMAHILNVDNAPIERVRLKDLTATQPGVKREGVRAHLENPNLVAHGQRSLSGQLNDRPVVVRHADKTYIADGHHRLAAKKLMGHEDAMVRVVGLPADQGQPQDRIQLKKEAV